MTAVLATVLGMCLCAPSILAGESDREGRWQMSVPITFTSGATVDGQQGTSFKLNDDVGLGFGFGYNLNPHFMVGVDFTWLTANYDASISTDINNDHIPDTKVDLAGTLDAANLQFVGQYNILKGRVTPFLRASLGWTWIDSNIPAGPAVGSCWWDPWYGYVCGTWQPTYGATRFAYGAAAGVRGEVAERFYLEASYNVLWLDTSQSGTPSMDGVRVTAGWVF
jgi:opacity protein-like surface antigen